MSRRNPEINTSERTVSRKEKLSDVLLKRQPGLTVVAENIFDPHNLSAMLRSCDAVGILEICLIYDGKQPYPKLGNKSSASAKKWVDIRKFDNIKNCYEVLRSEGKKIYSTHMGKNSLSLYELDLIHPVALVFGNEHTGLSEEAAELADANFLIPQVGMIQSLNISVACAVSLYEAYRQRLNANLYDNVQFENSDFNHRLENWLKK
jgi:tRNA (guanosine-2'-O-)-methyltransferase